MVASARDIKLLLKTADQSDAAVEDFKVPELGQSVIAVEVTPKSSLVFWRLLKAQVAETGRIPLLVSLLGNPQPSWRESVKADGPHLFNRHPFVWELGEPTSCDMAPQAIIERSRGIEVDAELAARRQNFELDVEGNIDWKLDNLKLLYGASPSKARVIRSIWEASDDSWLASERFMFEWSLKRAQLDGTPGLKTYWHKPIEPMALLLLPISEPWQIPAYIHWYGADDMGSDLIVAALRSWQEAYGAELVCHYGTMLQFQVQRPIRSAPEAFVVAAQHETLGMLDSACETARLLNGARRWHLHRRP